MEEKMDTEKVISDGMEVPEENPSAPEGTTFAGTAATEGTAFTGTTATEGTAGAGTFTTEGPNGEEPPEEVKKKTFLRACGSWTDIIPIAAMLSFILINLGGIASWILDATLIPAREIGMRLLGDADSVEFLLQYFEFYGIWLAFMLVILLFRDNWPMWKAFLYNRHGNNLKAIPAGILLGFGMNGFCVLMSVIMGDIKLSFNGFAPLPFFVFLLCVTGAICTRNFAGATAGRSSQYS